MKKRQGQKKGLSLSESKKRRQRKGKFQRTQSCQSKDSGQIECNYVVDDRQWTYSAPGSKSHNLGTLDVIHTPDFGEFIHMHGGTSLLSDCSNLPTNIYSLQRHEGLTEVWQESPVWFPKRGWIETITCFLPKSIENRTIDAQILEGRRVVNRINNSD